MNKPLPEVQVRTTNDWFGIGPADLCRNDAASSERFRSGLRMAGSQQTLQHMVAAPQFGYRHGMVEYVLRARKLPRYSTGNSSSDRRLYSNPDRLAAFHSDTVGSTSGHNVLLLLEEQGSSVRCGN